MADAGRAQSAIVKANRDAQNRISRSIGQAQSAVASVQADLSTVIMSDIERAAIPLVELGVELPSQRELQAMKVGLLPVIAEQQSAQAEMTCLVHVLDDAVRVRYTVLMGRLSEVRGVVQPAEASRLISIRWADPRQSWFIVFSFAHWWTAELACRLALECGWTLQQIQSKAAEIDQVQIWPGTGQGQAIGLCGGAKIMWPDIVTQTQHE
jgi:hypothetical protein